ncbi:MAG: energy-coupling factor transporter ATPase [Clostridia bacterium]|nr:energy-coupling factor transporter ATPase [Clostridia bacterium]
MAIIELEGVSYIYGAKTPYEMTALDNIDLKIEKGAITGLIGHTGSGKSTLVQILNGLLRPTSGRVLLDGKDIWAEPKKIRDVRFKVGLVMQYPEYQLFDETVRADIAFGLRNMKVPEDQINERVERAAEFSNLDLSLLDKSPFDLSGGQRRRAAIAGVIAMSPEVLVLDEPAAGLDPRGRREILDGVKHFSRESGTTVIIVSHSMEDMAQYCDNAAVLSRGKLFMYGSCSEVFGRAPMLCSVGLDIPHVTRINQKLIELGLPLPEDVYTVDYAANKIAALLGLGGDGK